MMVLAHGLYLDDFLWFAIPVGFALAALRWAERRARMRAEAEAQSGDEALED